MGRVDLSSIIKEKVLILDGAMGTMIQQYKLSEDDFRGELFRNHDCLLKGNNDLLCLTRPDIISDIHRKYLDAGADIIETNTFNANRISMADYRTQAYVHDINAAAVRLARKVSDEYSLKTPDKPRFVVGSVGPTNKTCSISPDVENPAFRELTFDELSDAYIEQMSAMVEEGVDAILIETIFDSLNAKAAIYAANKVMEGLGVKVPVMLSVTIAGNSGRTLSGQTLDAFCASVSNFDIFSIGLNCSFGAKQMKPFIKHLSSIAPYYISAYPNAGLPNEFGLYEQTPEDMVVEVSELLYEGVVNIIGGCCGTTDKHIRLYSDIIGNAKRHEPVHRNNFLSVSGLECLNIVPENNFINIGERCNVAGSRKFLRLIKEKKYDEALSIAREQVERGAQILDVNMDDGMLDVKAEMVNFLNLISSDPDIARVPIMIDSSKWDVIVAGLKCLQGKSIVNSISLKDGEEVFISKAIEVNNLGAAIVVMAFDERGQADTYERKIEICKRAYDILVEKAKICPSNIIFDPNILAIGTGIKEHDGYALNFIKAVQWIRENLPGANVSGGVSNLSFAFRGNDFIREAIHAVFLHHAIKAGMNMGIVNPYSKINYSDLNESQIVSLENFILNRSDNAINDIMNMAGHVSDEIDKNKTEIRNMPLEKRLSYSLQHGTVDHLDEDLMEAIEKYDSPIDIIEGPLMDGMNIVGEMFAEGKMFLPQVVKTARTMKKAVGILQPYIEKNKNEKSQSNGKVLLATVKGDVHDIGKNIVSVVMSCNNYEMIDLGVMVPAETIVDAVKKYNVDAVGLSGLITPSLDEMINVVRLMKQNGINIPVMIGGATTSKKHTAVKIAPEYDGPVIYVKDASQNVPVLKKILNKDMHDDYLAQINAEYENIRNKTNNATSEDLMSLENARKNKPNFFE